MHCTFNVFHFLAFAIIEVKQINWDLIKVSMAILENSTEYSLWNRNRKRKKLPRKDWKPQNWNNLALWLLLNTSALRDFSNSWFSGLTSMVKLDDHAMTRYDHGDWYSPWYDHGKIMSWSSWNIAWSWHGHVFPTRVSKMYICRKCAKEPFQHIRYSQKFVKFPIGALISLNRFS